MRHYVGFAQIRSHFYAYSNGYFCITLHCSRLVQQVSLVILSLLFITVVLYTSEQ